MTDRELLELAAKAAGLENEPCVNGWNEKYSLGWNPLIDDGDALWLAVKLNLSLDLFDNEIAVGYTSNCNDCEQLVETTAADPYAATRRAIVRAAAEIGKQK